MRLPPFIPQIVSYTPAQINAGQVVTPPGAPNDGKIYRLREAHILLAGADTCSIDFGIDSCEGASFDVTSLKNFDFVVSTQYLKTWGEEAFSFGYKIGDASERDKLTLQGNGVTQNASIKLYWESR